MRSVFVKRLICALLCALLLCTQASALDFDGIGATTPNFGEGEILDSDGAKSNNILNTPYDDQPTEDVVYTPVELADSTKDFFATLDGDVTLTLISSQRDFVNGTYVEYFNDFYTDDKNYYYAFINTLKTISELNEYVKLEFVDPFSISSYAFLDEYKKYDLEYGDLFVTCYSNFDGSPTTRHSVLSLNKLFKTTEDKKGRDKIKGLNVEKTLVGKLESLRNYRNINVAYITDMCAEENIEYLKSYLSGKRYNFENVTLKDEKLNGYDMILIAAPVRDVTLEEIVLLNSFLDNGGEYGKTVMYFCSERYVKLSNLHSFLRKWGVSVTEADTLMCAEKSGYFAKNSQMTAMSQGSDYTANSDKSGGTYIMDNCTPISVVKGVSGVDVKTILKTRSDKVDVLPKKKRRQENEDESEIASREYPLLTLSQKSTDDNAPSSVVVTASVDFITSYLALQNPRSNKDFKGELNSNLELTAELLENLNQHHRSEESGLGKYAVGLADMGYDTTSGLETEYILQTAIAIVAVFIILLVALLGFYAKKQIKKSTLETKPEEN